MATTTYSPTPLLGINFGLKTTDPLVDVGTFVPLNSELPGRLGRWALYVQASAVIGNSSYVTVTLTSISCLAASVNGAGTGTDGYFRNGSVAFAANEYGWVFSVNTYLPKSLP